MDKGQTYMSAVNYGSSDWS